MKLTYLMLDAGTILFPLLLSFDRKVSFWKSWKYLFPAMLLTAAFFIGWDIFFTEWKVWAFNPQYLLGIYLFGLPLEEWLFFFCVPYACVFIYEVLKAYIRRPMFYKAAQVLSILMVAILLLLAAFNTHHIYTEVAFVSTAVMLLAQLVLRNRWLGVFFMAYLVQLIPFLLVNGILTSLPVVSYSDAANLGFRIYTIPVEDTVYSMLLLLMNISLLEAFRAWGRRGVAPLSTGQA